MLILTILFLLSKTQNYLSLSYFISKGNQKLSNRSSKGFERSVYWTECKTKSGNKNTTDEYRHFLESNLVGVNRLFVLVYSNQDGSAER